MSKKRLSDETVPSHIDPVNLFPGRGKSNYYTTPRKELAEQIVRDEREEMVEDVLAECVDAALATDAETNSGKLDYTEAEALVRSILLTAANIWGIGRDTTQSS